MPTRPCLRCGALIRSGSYCRAHQPRYPGSQRSSGPQARFRCKTLERWGDVCAACGATEGIEAHHLDEQEGVPLCQRCHRKIEAAKHKSQARRRKGR